MEKLSESLDTHQKSLEGATYASVLAGGGRNSPQRTALHSVIVTSGDETETGGEVLEKVRKAVNAKEGGIVVDRIRKAKDRKVIVGCRSQEEMKKVKQRIQERGVQLNVEEIQNKDPLIILYGVLSVNTDGDIVEAIRVQNGHLLKGLGDEEKRVEIRFRRKARNPLTMHVVARVSPLLWKRLTEAGAVQVDMQRVRVADQSPLVQCSRCLGYGHGRRFCRDAADVCSHCGGQHMRAQCAEWMAETAPSCTNCVKAKMLRIEHNAFSKECPVRSKWESLARSTVAYC